MSWKNRDSQNNEPPLDPRAERLLAAAAATRPLPEALRARLLELPREAEAGDANERRFERALAVGLAPGFAEGFAGEAERAAAGTPEARTQRTIARWIAEGRRSAPLPAALRARLLAIGRGRRSLPVWLDFRWAAAACLLLTLLSTLAVGEASALLGDRATGARETREEWQGVVGETLRTGGEDAWSFLTGTYHRGRQILASRGEELRDVYAEKLRHFNQSELGRRLAGEPSTRGTNDGKP